MDVSSCTEHGSRYRHGPLGFQVLWSYYGNWMGRINSLWSHFIVFMLFVKHVILMDHFCHPYSKCIWSHNWKKISFWSTFSACSLSSWKISCPLHPISSLCYDLMHQKRVLFCTFLMANSKEVVSIPYWKLWNSWKMPHQTLYTCIVKETKHATK